MKNKLGNATKTLLTICGIVCLLGVLYVFVSFFLQKRAVENTENNFGDALGLVVLFIVFSIPCAVLNLGLSIYSFAFSSKVKKIMLGKKKPSLLLARFYLIFALLTGALSGVISFASVYFEPVSLILGAFYVAVSIVALICVVKMRKSIKNRVTNVSSELEINE